MSDQEFEVLVQQGDAFATQGKWDQAIAMWRKALEINPRELNLRRNITHTALKKGDYQEAVREYLAWARACQAQGAVDDGIRIYQELLGLEASVEKKSFLVDRRTSGARVVQIRELLAIASGEIFYNLGVLYLEKGAVDDAMACLKRSLDIAPGNARIHMALGQAYMKKGMDKEAQGEFQEVIRLAPSDAAFAYEMLGEIFIKSGKPPQSTLVWCRNAGDLYLKHNQFKDAIRVYENILNFDSRNKDILNKIGEIYAQNGIIEKAVSTFLRLTRIYTDEGLLDKVIVLYEKILDWDAENTEAREKIIDIYRKILLSDPSNLSARHKLIGNLLRKGSAEEAVPEFLALAGTYLEKGMLDEGLSVCQKLLDIEPKNLEAHEILGEIYFKQENQKESMEQFFHVLRIYKERGDDEGIRKINEKLVSLFPDQTEIHYQLALTHIEKESFDEALGELKLVLEDSPNHVQALVHMGDIFGKQGMTEESLEYYLRILELQPQMDEIREIVINYYIGMNKFNEAHRQALILAEEFMYKGKIKEAEGLYTRLLSYFPDDLDIRSRLCSIYTASGRTEKALDEYLFMANLYCKKELFLQAIGMCQKFLEFNPQDLNAKYKLSKIYARQGMVSEALANLVSIADLYINRELIEPAIRVIKETLELAPHDIGQRQKLVGLLLRQNRIEEAVGEHKILLESFIGDRKINDAAGAALRIVSIYPEDLALREDLSRIYHQGGMPEQARLILEELIQQYLYDRNFDKVISLYREIGKIHEETGDRASYWHSRQKIGQLFIKTKRMGEAKNELFSIAEGLIRDNDLKEASIALDGFVELFVEEGKFDEAFDRIKTMADGFAEAGQMRESLFVLERLEANYEKLYQWDRALELLDIIAAKYLELDERAKAIDFYSTKARIYLQNLEMKSAAEQNLAIMRIRLSAGEVSMANLLYQEILKMVPNNLDVIQKCADLYFEYEFFDEALPIYFMILGRDPENYEAVSKISIIYARQGNLQESVNYARKVFSKGLLANVIEEYEKVSHLQPDDAQTHLNVGVLYKEMGFMDEAVIEFQRAAREPQKLLPAYNLLGLVFKEKGLTELAIRQFQRALEKNGYKDEEYQEIRYNLASTYQGMGRLKEALDTFQECYAVDIKYRDVYQKIEELNRILAKNNSAPPPDKTE